MMLITDKRKVMLGQGLITDCLIIKSRLLAGGVFRNLCDLSSLYSWLLVIS